MHYLEEELFDRFKKGGYLFSFLLQSSLDGFWYWDMENPEHEWYSSCFKRLFGYAGDEIPNLSSWWQENVFPEDLEVASENARKHLETPSHPFDQIVRYRHKDGSVVWVRCRGLAVRDENRKPVRMLGAHTDVSALMRERLELQRINKDLRIFSSLLSHDLREPFRTISLYSSMLRKDLGDKVTAKSLRCLNHISKAAEKMEQKIDDLLSIFVAQSCEMRREEVKVQTLIEGVLEDLKAQVEESGAIITWSLPHTIKGDPSLLGNVFQNLVSNAIKFRKPGSPPSIRITSEDCKANAKHVLLRVADEGQGIQEEHWDKVFKPFRQADKKAPGSGVGLSIVQNIIERHGGTIWVTSEPGAGATFSFTLERA